MGVGASQFKDPARRDFSQRWVWLSMAMFIASELFIGGFLGELIAGRMLSINTGFLMQGLLNLAGFVLGGFVIGVVSPGRRIIEPALAGFATIILIAILTLFVPFRYMGYTGSSLLLAGLLAAALGAGGAYLGERLTGNLSPTR